MRKYGNVKTNENNANFQTFSLNGDEVRLEKLGKTLAFKNKVTKGPRVIAVPIMAAKKSGFKTVRYGPENNGHTLRYLGFTQATPYSSYILNLNKIKSDRLEKLISGDLTNYKKYMNSISLSKVNKFNRGLKNLGLEKTKRNERVISTPNKQETLRMIIRDNSIQFNLGKTNLDYTNKFLKGVTIPILAARNAGFKNIRYGPENNGHTLRYLGFSQSTPNGNFVLNLNKINSNRLEKIISGDLNNYKKYMNSRPLSKVNKFNKGLRNLGNAIVVNRPSRTERILSTPNKKASLRLLIDKNSIQYSLGQTNKNYRGKGYGTMLRSIPIQIARNAGFKKILHSSLFLDPDQERMYKSQGRTVPPSRFIVQKLGFVPISNTNSVLIL